MRPIIAILAVLLLAASPRQTPIPPTVPFGVSLTGPESKIWRDWTWQEVLRWQNYDQAVASIPSEIGDSVAAHWSVFTADDTLEHSTVGAIVHDSLDANWATFIEDDTTHPGTIGGIVNDSLQVYWARLVDTMRIVQAAVFLPHQVRDTVANVLMYMVEDILAPNGIRIHEFGLKTVESSSYTLILRKFATPDDGSPDAVDTVATSSSREAESTPNPSNKTVAAGEILQVLLPATVTDMIYYYIVFVVI